MNQGIMVFQVGRNPQRIHDLCAFFKNQRPNYLDSEKTHGVDVVKTLKIYPTTP